MSKKKSDTYYWGCLPVFVIIIIYIFFFENDMVKLATSLAASVFFSIIIPAPKAAADADENIRQWRFDILLMFCSICFFCHAVMGALTGSWDIFSIFLILSFAFFLFSLLSCVEKPKRQPEVKPKEMKSPNESVAEIVEKYEASNEYDEDDDDYDDLDDSDEDWDNDLDDDLEEDLQDDDVHYMDEDDLDMENWEADGNVFEDDDSLDIKRQKMRHYKQKIRRQIEEYFYDVNRYVTELLNFSAQLDCDASFKTYTNSLQNINIKFACGEKYGDLAPDTFRGKLQIIMLIDLVRNFEHAGHELDLLEKEQFIVLLYVYRMKFQIRMDFNNEEVYDAMKEDYEDFFYKKEINKEFEDFVRQFMDCEQVDEVFYISHLLNGYNDELRKKYHILMYRVISFASKYDGDINEEETSWMEQVVKIAEKSTLPPHAETVTPASISTEDSFTKLNELIGLCSVKSEVSTLADLIKIQQQRKEKGLKIVSPSYHCVFTGNPGTGKTTVARILAEIYRSLGILEKGHLVETDRSGLVAEYVGQTAVKTNKIIDNALDGVLFIDEAYTLVGGGENDFGREAIATLLKRMEDDRKRLVVILAGYTDEMKQFIDSNPGLQSRFNRYIEFPDYNADELLQIFESNVTRYDYQLTAEARDRVTVVLAKAVRSKDKNFGNARFVRNLFDKTVERQSCRLAVLPDVSVQQLSILTVDDIPDATD